jgi:hypothetical protein
MLGSSIMREGDGGGRERKTERERKTKRERRRATVNCS